MPGDLVAGVLTNFPDQRIQTRTRKLCHTTTAVADDIMPACVSSREALAALLVVHPTHHAQFLQDAQRSVDRHQPEARVESLAPRVDRLGTQAFGIPLENLDDCQARLGQAIASVAQ